VGEYDVEKKYDFVTSTGMVYWFGRMLE